MVRATSLHDYLNTIYQDCHVNKSFLATWQGFVYPTHVIQALSLLIQVLAFYLILSKTPASMKSVKWSLLGTHVCSTLFDLTCCTMVTPYVFYPSFVVFCYGILHLFKFSTVSQLSMFFLMIFALGISLIILFESRSKAISTNRFKFYSQEFRVSFYLFQYISYCSIAYFIRLKIPENQEELKLKTLDEEPCPVEQYFHPEAVFIFPDTFWFRVTFFLLVPIICSLISIQIVFHCGCCMYYLYFDKSALSLSSSNTQRLQLGFFIGILISALVITTTLALPFICFFIAFFLNSVDQKLVSLLVMLLETHGLFESLALILVHHPYRKGVKQLFCLVKETKINTGSRAERFGRHSL